MEAEGNYRAASRVLFVAASGERRSNGGGLYRYAEDVDGSWARQQLAKVDKLAALCRHPRLPIIYGVSGLATGTLHTWVVAGSAIADEQSCSSGGVEPCHVSINPAGSILAVCNYGSGYVSLFSVDDSGSIVGNPVHHRFEGHGPELARQESAHPHQAVFDPDGLHLTVIDLGSDAVHRLSYEGTAVVAHETVATPPGSGPRHVVTDGSELICISGELDSTVLVPLSESTAGWRSVRSTKRVGPATTRSPRNYPGDIASHPSAPVAYVANRGYDTIGVVSLAAGKSELLQEVDSGAPWPQHILVTDTELLVACADGSRVTALTLNPASGRIIGQARTAFECDGASWLLTDVAQ